MLQNTLEQLEENVSRVEEEKKEYISLASDIPYSKWQSIYNLDTIKERNKPILAKKEMPKLPFFLFDLQKVIDGETEAEG